MVMGGPPSPAFVPQDPPCVQGRRKGPLNDGALCVYKGGESHVDPFRTFQREFCMRPSGRAFDDLRPIRLEAGYAKYAEGSCLARFGETHVLCTASVEDKVPGWLRGGAKGWITAEYGMLPRSTHTRTQREAARGGQSGRTQEIQRLIGRSLRAVTDLKGLGEIQIRLDCDVLQADGGTRTASVTGAYVALYQALAKLCNQNKISRIAVREPVAAVSCGLVGGQAVLDLDYAEDSVAQADANFVMTASGLVVEIQGTAETAPFSTDHFQQLLGLAQKGTALLVEAQKQALGSLWSDR